MINFKKISVLLLAGVLFLSGTLSGCGKQKAGISGAKSIVQGGVYSSPDSSSDSYNTVSTKESKSGDYTYDGVEGIKRMYDPNEFPDDPTFGFSDKTLDRDKIGLKSNQAYYMSRMNGLSLWEYSGGYDQIMFVSALQGITNRVVNGSLMIDETWGGYGFPETQKAYYENTCGMEFVAYKKWSELLPEINKAFNGIIIFEDAAELNSEASMLMYNLANISGCLPVQRKLYDMNTKAFEGMEVVAYFKKGISMFSALNYSTRVVLPLTSKTDAFCPSVKLGNNIYSSYQIMSAAEASMGNDFAFVEKMYILNTPSMEHMPTFKYFERVMNYLEAPAVVWGWVTGASEAFFSPWGHGLNEGTQNTNFSFLSSVPVQDSKVFPYKNSVSDIKYNPDKMYISFSGESLDAGMFVWNEIYKFYQSEDRGKIKINWGWPASYGRLFKSPFEMMFNTATENDYFYNFCGDSYIHTEAMSLSQIKRWQEKTLENASSVMNNATPWFSIANQDTHKYAKIAENQPDTSLYVVTEATIPSGFYSYNYIKPLNNDEYGAKYMTRGTGYAWQSGWSGLTVEGSEKNEARLDVQKAADYLLSAYNSDQRMPLFSFWNISSYNVIKDYIALAELLTTNPKYAGKFEIVSLGEMNLLAKQIPKSYLDNIKNQTLAKRNAALKASSIEKPAVTRTENDNYVFDFIGGGASNLRVDELTDGIKLVLDSDASVNIYNTYTGNTSTVQTVLPKGARYVVVDTNEFLNYGDSLILQLKGNFAKDGGASIVNLNGASNTAGNVKSGRVVLPLSEEIYEYTDQGYPVSLSIDFFGRSVGASVQIENIQFVSELPEEIPTLRINGSYGNRLKDTYFENDTAYYPVEEILIRLGLKYTVSGKTVSFKIGSEAKTVKDLTEKDGKLYIAYTGLIDGCLPYDVWYNTDKSELSINQ